MGPGKVSFIERVFPLLGESFIGGFTVQGYKQKKAFIIAQGPLESTCSDFWQMIHQFQCGTIVMLSSLKEYKQVAIFIMYRNRQHR